MESKTEARRRHSPEIKAAVLAACAAPGASVAAIALAHGLNANLVHKWRRGRGSPRGVQGGAKVVDGFIALPMLSTTAAPVPPNIHLELRRGPTTVSVSWPMAASGECAAWLRECLK